jgi:hypothetical protein
MFGPTHTLFVDVSLDASCVALVENVRSKHAKIIATRTVQFNTHQAHYHKTLVALKTQLHEMVHMLVKEYAVKHYDVIFLVHSPLCTSRSVQHTYAFKKETVVTKLHIQEVLESARKAAQEASTEGAPLVFREYITAISLNGYQTESPIGKVASEASCTIVQETLAAGVKKAVIDPVITGGIKYEVYNYAQLVGSMLAQTISSNEPRFGLIEMTTETSEITLYNRKTLDKHIIVPVGMRHMLNSAERKLHLTHEFIHGLLKSAGAKDLSEDVMKSVQSLTDEVVMDMQKKIEPYRNDALSIPPRMFITSERGTEHFWTAVISRVFQHANVVLEKIMIDGTILEYTHAHDQRMVIGIFAHAKVDHKNQQSVA